MVRTRASLAHAAVAVVAFAAASTAATTASAQAVRGFALERYAPAEKGSEWLVLDSLDFRRQVQPAFGATLDYADRPLTIYDANGDARSNVVADQLFVHLGASVVAWRRLRIGFDLPVAVLDDGTSGSVSGVSYLAPSSGFGVGDVRFAIDGLLYGRRGRGPLRVGLGSSLWIPSGSRDDWTGDGTVGFEPHLMAAGDVTSSSSMGLVWAARAGVRYRARDEVVERVELGTDLTWGVSGGVRAAGGKLVIGPEIFGQSTVSGFGTKRATGAEGLLSAHLAVAQGVRLAAGAGVGLSKAFGTPLARLLFGVEWVVPYTAEDDRDDEALARARAAEEARNAARPKSDRDHDGVADLDDGCPDVPGVPNPSDPLANGCPADRDKDFVPDAVDACPDVRGSKSSDPKRNGCPSDKDGDGIPDDVDACENEPGTKTDDPATNGCADPDRDHDGIPNDIDACPDDAGPANTQDPKMNGCPAVRVRGDRMVPVAPIAWAVGPYSVELAATPSNDAALGAIAQTLKDRADITKVHVEVHTDDSRLPEESKRVSQGRASTIVKWLTKHGVDASRLAAEGHGSDQPLYSNADPAGRKKNERVELRFETGAGK